MANTKKQFMVMYDQAVDLLKRFKQSNDILNKSIGVDQDSSISLKIRAEQASHNIMMKKLDQILQKLQQSYLDPDTARKIGTVKQQYKIQKDRRTHIQKSLIQLTQNNTKIPHQSSQTQHYFNYKLNNTNSQNYAQRRKNIDEQRYSNSTKTTSNTIIHRQHEEQITEYDYQIQCKLLQEKNKAISQAQKKILNVYDITKDIQEMVHYQGEHVDMISDYIYKANENTKESVKELKEANEQSKKRRKKIFTLSLLLLITVIVLFAFLLA